MKMLKVFEKRRSVREYKEKVLSAVQIARIMELTEQCPNPSDNIQVDFMFMENGPDVAAKLNGIAGYNGVMIPAPHYLVILASPERDGFKVAGYAGEWLALSLTKEDIGTCWLDAERGEEIKQKLHIDSPMNIVGLLAVGTPKYDPRLSNIYDTNMEGSVSPLTDLGYPHIKSEYSGEPVSGRLSIEELAYLRKWGVRVDAEELQKRGYDEVFYYMRLAPSWGNRQPWRFILDGTRVVLVMARDERVHDDIEDVEAGIAMLYFEVAMHDIGLPGHWNMDELTDTEKYNIPDGHFIGGYYTF